MVQIEVRRPATCPPGVRTWRWVIWIAVALLLLWSVWSTAGNVSAQPPVGARVALPILSFVGSDATNQTFIQVQNVGSDFTQAIMLVWGDAGACGPQAVGPFKVECSGLLKPGATWLFVDSQIPQGGKSALVYSFPVDEIVIDGKTETVANAFCERLFENVVFDADAFRRFDMAFQQGDLFLGLPTTGGQPLAVDVVRLGQGDPSPELLVTGSYSGITTAEAGAWDPVFGSFSYYAPVVYADALGLNSFLYIQNTGNACTTVELWFQEQEACLDANICEIFTLAPGETATFDVNECVGPGFVGSVWIRTSQPAGVVVDHIGQDILMTDKGVAATNALFNAGSEVLFGPLIFREYQGWQSSVTVQNLSGTRFATVKVYFYDESGNVITTIVDWICPRGSQTFFLPVINGLPGRFVGAIRVESLTTFRNAGGLQEFVPIAGVAHLVRYSDPTAAVPLEAISYNLFPEPKAFDWQFGPSGAGLIGIPSLLKNVAGLSTEIAIQNVNPNPGFTNFAIFIYDDNGLLDFVCETLGSMNVEYINANAWGYLNPGFAGSAVISAVYTNQQGGFGLTAVSIERVGAILQFDVPGDESSGQEAFPISGEFHFQGQSAPLCPGFDCSNGSVTVNVTIDGVPADVDTVNLKDTATNGAIFDADLIKTGVGTYTTDPLGVPASIPGTTDYTLTITKAGFEIPSTFVNVECGEDVTITIELFTTATISGTVWLDVNGDGVVDNVEGVVSNQKVLILDPATSTVLGSGDTNGDGLYDITFAPPGPLTFDPIVVVLDADNSGTLTAGDTLSAPIPVQSNTVLRVDIDMFDAIQFYVR